MGMTWLELAGIAVGLSMDAFAVSLCKGLAVGKTHARHMLLAGLWFGFFQMLMPVLGWLLGTSFSSAVSSFAPWIAFGLLSLIGGNMLRECIHEEDEKQSASFDPLTMAAMAVATSIDALATGVAFAAMEAAEGAVNGPGSIWTAVACIGATTFVLSAAGIYLGGRFGDRFGWRAEMAGGLTLIAIGLRILLEHFS